MEIIIGAIVFGLIIIAIIVMVVINFTYETSFRQGLLQECCAEETTAEGQTCLSVVRAEAETTGETEATGTGSSADR